MEDLKLPTAKPTNRNDLTRGIHGALGIDAESEFSDRERRIVDVIGALPEDHLAGLLAVSKRARELSVLEPGEERRRAAGSSTGEAFTGEDCWYIRDLLYMENLDDIFLLATAINQIPKNLSIRHALLIIKRVKEEMFDLSDPSVLAAHLRTAHSLEVLSDYTPMTMMVVNMHPDKTDTIVTLSRRTNRTPTHRDILVHHGVAPVFYDGAI